ncbi:IclR family transcriptional regulator [Nitratireductor indicus]|nr:IclR family transcriptional regulator [Nitratireductor indicus]SFQ53550.1 transcriptional regulator, IclR family [Nitratireductor indicus]
MTRDKTDTERTPHSPGRSGTIQSVAIASRFLKVLASARGPMALSEVAKETRTGASTAHRYLRSLIAEGFAAQDPASGRYDLGPAALGIGMGALRRIEPVEVAARHMKKLAGSLAASAGVAIWTERGPTLVRWYRSAYFSISTVMLGDVLPVDNSACGLVFQAFMTPKMVDAARQQQPANFRGTQPDAARLSFIRQAGAAELNEHLFSSLTGKAAAIFDAQGEIACVVTTVSLIDAARSEEHFSLLVEAANAASKECGGTA